MKTDLRDRNEEVRQLGERVRELQPLVGKLQQVQSELGSAKTKNDDFERNVVPTLRQELRDAKVALEEMTRRVRDLEMSLSAMRQWEPKYMQLKMEFDR